MTIAAPVTQPDSGDTARESPSTARESPDTARESPCTARGPPDTAEETHHRLKDVRWLDAQTNTERVVRIATQNENGPCPLLALANVLALEGHITLASAKRPIVSDEELVSVLANHLVSLTTNAEEDVTAALSLLPSLRTGLDVDLQFTHIHDFADAPPLRLFRAFGVDVVHGWVVSAEEDPVVAQALADHCNNGYEGAVEFVLQSDDSAKSAAARDPLPALAVRAWLDRTASQLTDHGLRLLETQLPDHHVCVLFRNNHFSVLYKHHDGGKLYLLCTDDGLDDRIVWESLCDVRQTASEFVDAHFEPPVLRAMSEAVGPLQKREEGGRLAADYSRQMSAPPASGGASSQMDSDFAFALLLQQEEEAAGRKANAAAREAGGRRWPVRQQEREDRLLPPGTSVRQDSRPYGLTSDNAFVPNEAASGSAHRMGSSPKSPSPKSKSIEDRCSLM
ncbi:hypothetical protein LPJ59_004502 [Coemansia sp. RSA 2399]|nr:hypothetical protein LPJ59_004502 [Coemansia sp. RSA 2399]KAJ1895580.1 hypothetical protein LPJ81_004929 [Coemansia sp. IMI 209127]